MAYSRSKSNLACLSAERELDWSTRVADVVSAGPLTIERGNWMMLRHGFVLTVGMLAGSACVTTEATSETGQAVALADRVTACSRDPRVVAGVAGVDTCVGADLFLR